MTTNKINDGLVFRQSADDAKVQLVFPALLCLLFLVLPPSAHGQFNKDMGATRTLNGMRAPNVNPLTAAAQQTLDQKLAEQKKAQSQLALAKTAAVDAAKGLEAANGSAAKCIATLPIFGRTNAQLADCKAKLADAERYDTAARLMVITRTTELKAADVAVAKATDERNKASLMSTGMQPQGVGGAASNTIGGGLLKPPPK